MVGLVAIGVCPWNTPDQVGDSQHLTHLNFHQMQSSEETVNKAQIPFTAGPAINMSRQCAYLVFWLFRLKILTILLPNVGSRSSRQMVGLDRSGCRNWHCLKLLQLQCTWTLVHANWIFEPAVVTYTRCHFTLNGSCMDRIQPYQPILLNWVRNWIQIESNHRMHMWEPNQLRSWSIIKTFGSVCVIH